MIGPIRLLGTVSATLLAGAFACAQSGEQDPSKSLTKMALEDLMSVEVTTATKRPQSAWQTAAAVYVLTAEDIRRSGALSIPDLLRLVPGANVSQIDANKWSVSLRGFGSRYANKLQVMIDGQSVYTPLFSGVYWDALEIPLETIERIEVIRGPGGALWGANAVNGILNIVTKTADKTQGTDISASLGDFDRHSGMARFGGTLGSAGHYRILVRGFDRRGFEEADSSPADNWNGYRTGARFDWVQGERDKFFFRAHSQSMRQGGAFEVPILAAPYSELVESRFDTRDWTVSGGWTREFEDGSANLQLHASGSDRRQMEACEKRTTLELDFQRSHNERGSHRLTWGASLQRSSDRIRNSALVAFSPSRRTKGLASLFLQDEITVSPHSKLIVGAKLEHNEDTGLELQPNVRFVGHADPKQVVWASLSKAARTPSRAERDVRVDLRAMEQGGMPAIIRLLGNPNFDSAHVLACEAGLRREVSDKILLDLAAYYNVYDGLRTFEPEAPIFEPLPVPHLVLPHRFDNKASAKAYGIEAAVDVFPSRSCRIRAGYTLEVAEFRLDSDSGDPFGRAADDRPGNTPRHQGFLRTSMELARGWELDLVLRGVDRLPGADIPGYFTADLRVGYRSPRGMEASFGLRNFLAGRHREDTSALYEVPRRVPASAYLTVSWRN